MGLLNSQDMLDLGWLHGRSQRLYYHRAVIKTYTAVQLPVDARDIEPLVRNIRSFAKVLLIFFAKYTEPVQSAVAGGGIEAGYQAVFGKFGYQ